MNHLDQLLYDPRERMELEYRIRVEVANFVRTLAGMGSTASECEAIAKAIIRDAEWWRSND